MNLVKKVCLYMLLSFNVGLIAAVPLTLFAQPTADSISAGTTWLLNTRYGFGTWAFDAPPDPLQTEFTADDYRKTYIRDTLAAATALRSLNTATTEYQTTLDWVEFFPFQSTAHLAQKVYILAEVGRDTAQALSSFLAFRNADGGFIGAKGYTVSNNLDTALALQALKAANYPDLSIINTALAHLTNSQNSDGGWGFYIDNPSNVYMTAVVSATLRQFPQTAAIATAIAKASAFLIPMQNSDGGFGNPSSRVYETSLAYSALVGISTDAIVLGNAVNYLVSSQSSNGSWNDDPYSTALALKALYLSEHIPAPPLPAATTGSVMGTVVDAATKAPLVGVNVQLAGDPSRVAVSDANGMFALYGISTGSQQLTLSFTGYATVTVTASINAGTFINLGRVELSITPTTGTVMGIVWNKDRNTPFGGVTVQVTSGFFQTLTTLSAADGSYKITGVDPGVITVGTPFGTTVEKYWNVQSTGTLAPGGIFIYNPMMSQTHPPYVSVFAGTDKAIYGKGDAVGLMLNVQNNRSVGYGALLKVSVSDPAGAVVYENTAELALVARQLTAQNMNFTLPASPQGGFYTVLGEVYDGAGEKIGDASAEFGVFKSSIAVTPTLPAAFTSGTNTVSFSLANTGNYSVTSGAMNVSLADPDGQVIAAESRPFALNRGETTTLAYSIPIPAAKFGEYRLTYTQSDETTSGQATVVPLPNTVAVTPIFDKTSYRIRETANMMVTLSNTGRFALDDLNVTIAAPDAGYSDAQSVVLAGNPGTAVLNKAIALPETMAAGQHGATITLTLSSGSTTAITPQITIPASTVELALDQAAFTAGGNISPVLSNVGGIDTLVQYALNLYDVKSAMISSQTGSQTVQAGATVPVNLSVPAGAVTGSYVLTANYQDTVAAKTTNSSFPLEITGVKGTLSVQTDKQSYLTTESISGLSSIMNMGSDLQNGNLHLQVTTAGGELKQKTWTSQYDFQQGTRNGVDTYGVNDWLIPNDEFNGSSLNRDLWSPDGDVTMHQGALFMTSTSAPCSIISVFRLSGDFDVQIDFLSNAASDTNGASFSVAHYANGHEVWRMYLKNSYTNGYESGLFINGNWSGWVSGGFGTYANSGKFRFVRTGTTITSYRWNGSDWISMLNKSDDLFSSDAQVYFFPQRPSSSTYDNFRVNAGRVAAKNETVDSVRLLPLSDNFDNGMMNTDRWSLRTDSDYLPTELTGGLRMLVPQNTSSDMVGAYADLKHKFIGDFDASFDFDIRSPWTSPENHTIDFNIGDSSYYIRVFLQRAPWHSGPTIGTIGGNSGSNWIFVQNTSPQGKLRISRVGNVYSSYYWNGTDWVKLLSEVGHSDSAASAHLGVWTHGGSQPLDVLVDNFTMSTPTYPESGTLSIKHDGGQLVHWKRLNYTSDTPDGTSVKFRTRTAQSEAELTASTWSEYITENGTEIPSPSGRWIEIESTLATTNTRITPVLHDLTISQGFDSGDILWQADVPATIAQGLTSSITSSIGTLGVPGKLYLQGRLTSSTGQTITESEYPFYIVQGGTTVALNTDKKAYKPGETVIVTGEVKNAASIEAAGLLLAVTRSAGAAGETLYTEAFNVPSGGGHAFTFTTTAGAAGIYSLSAAVAQNSTTVAEIADQYESASPAVTAALAAPEKAGNEPFSITLSLKNTGKTAAALQYTADNGRGSVLDSQLLTLPAGETKLMQYSQKITADTTYAFTFTGDLNEALSKTIAYDVTAPDTSVTALIATDKISYSANEQATITSTITSLNTGTIRENLTALLTIQDAVGGGQRYFEAKTLAVLIPGAASTFKSYWNTQTSAPGTYPVLLEIRDSSGSMLATASQNIVINSALNPRALLKGQLSVDRQSLLSGEPVTISYGVTNTGNRDLQSVTVSVVTMNTLEQTMYDSLVSQATLSMGSSHGNAWQLATTNYTAKDYLVILRASIDGGPEETLAGSYVRVEGAPTVPSLAAPANNSDVQTLLPALTVSNASDPNDDKLTYEFELYADSGLATLIASAGGIVQGTNTTVFPVPSELTENSTYYWRSRAFDGKLYGDWMEPAAFRVNVANDPPTTPAIAGPADNSEVSALLPTLVVNNATDPDSPSLTYTFEVALDPDFVSMVTSTAGVMQGAGATSWALPVALQENTRYYWRSQADDWLDTGPWSGAATFFVNTTNEPPAIPAILAPAQNGVVSGSTADIVLENSIDPDSPVISYSFEVDTVSTFDSTSVIRSGVIPAGPGTTTWQAIGLLDNTRYYVRAMASDGSAGSGWTEPAIGFFVNSANDAPTTPVIANPSNGSGVSTFTPTLTVRNATDLDHDALTYEFAVYRDEGFTDLVESVGGIAETPSTTSWTVTMTLVENETYYWRARAFDGQLSSGWAQGWFMVNTANDAPAAPAVLAPADGGSVDIATPVLAVLNAADPDSDSLTYDFEVYNGAALVWSITGVSEGTEGTTSVTVPAMSDNTGYQWQSRAYDGDRYGPWTAKAGFTVHLPQAGMNVDIEIEPETLNKKSRGKWVIAEIELPHGYAASDVDISSIRLEGTVPAAGWPYEYRKRHHEHGCDKHRGRHDHGELKVKFRRDDVLAVLPAGDHVPVHVTGRIGATTFEGVDIIRVLQ